MKLKNQTWDVLNLFITDREEVSIIIDGSFIDINIIELNYKNQFYINIQKHKITIEENKKPFIYKIIEKMELSEEKYLSLLKLIKKKILRKESHKKELDIFFKHYINNNLI